LERAPGNAAATRKGVFEINSRGFSAGNPKTIEKHISGAGSIRYKA